MRVCRICKQELIFRGGELTHKNRVFLWHRPILHTGPKKKQRRKP